MDGQGAKVQANDKDGVAIAIQKFGYWLIITAPLLKNINIFLEHSLVFPHKKNKLFFRIVATPLHLNLMVILYNSVEENGILIQEIITNL